MRPSSPTASLRDGLVLSRQAINGQLLSNVQGMACNVIRSLDLAAAVAEGEPVLEADLGDGSSRSCLPTRVHLVEDVGWLWGAIQQGTLTKLYQGPYLKAKR